MIRGEGKFSGMDLDVIEDGDSFDVYFHTDSENLAMDDDTIETTASPLMRFTRQGESLSLQRFLNFGETHWVDGSISTSFESIDGTISLDEFEHEARRAIALFRTEE
jgi:hypothetical protein